MMEYRSFRLPRETKILALGFIQLVLSCRPQVEFSTQSYIIGEDDIVLLGKSNTDEPAAPIADEVPDQLVFSLPLVVLQVDADTYKFCSGLLMPAEANAKGQRRMLTNHHCFLGLDDQQPDEQSCANTSVVFGFHFGVQEKASTHPCLPESFHSDSNLDVATFLIADPAAELGEGLQLSQLLPDEMLGKKAWIIHYPNLPQNLSPSSLFRHSLPLAAKTTTNCEVQQVFSQRFKEPILHYGIGHSCDLTHGSSGSALVDEESGEVLGINWGGIIYEQNEEKTTINVATAAPYVEQFLAGSTSIVALDSPNPSSGIEPEQKVAAASSKKNKSPKCGVIGSSAASPKAALGTTWPLALFALPLLLWRSVGLWIVLLVLGSSQPNPAMAKDNKAHQVTPVLAAQSDEQKVLMDASWLWFLGHTLNSTLSEPLAQSTMDATAKDFNSANQELITWLVVLEVLQPQHRNIWPPAQSSANEFLQLTKAASFQELKALRGKLAQGKIAIESFVTLALGTIPSLKVETPLIQALMTSSQLSCLVPQLTLETAICEFWDSFATKTGNLDKLSHVPTLTTYLALEQELRQERFPSVLRQLYQLQKSQELAAIPYRIVQMFYARQQKGSGKVALDHL